MSADSLPPELYQALCAFNAELLSHSAGGRTLLVQRLAELIRVGALAGCRRQAGREGVRRVGCCWPRLAAAAAG